MKGIVRHVGYLLESELRLSARDVSELISSLEARGQEFTSVAGKCTNISSVCSAEFLLLSHLNCCNMWLTKGWVTEGV